MVRHNKHAASAGNPPEEQKAESRRTAAPNNDFETKKGKREIGSDEALASKRALIDATIDNYLGEKILGFPPGLPLVLEFVANVSNGTVPSERHLLEVATALCSFLNTRTLPKQSAQFARTLGLQSKRGCKDDIEHRLLVEYPTVEAVMKLEAKGVKTGDAIREGAAGLDVVPGDEKKTRSVERWLRAHREFLTIVNECREARSRLTKARKEWGL